MQNYSRNPAVFKLQKGPIGLFGGNLFFFTNKEAYWATSIGSNGPFDSNFSGRFDSNFSWKPKKSRKTKKVRGRDRRPLIVFPVFLRDFQNPVWNGSHCGSTGCNGQKNWVHHVVNVSLGLAPFFFVGAVGADSTGLRTPRLAGTGGAAATLPPLRGRRQRTTTFPRDGVLRGKAQQCLNTAGVWRRPQNCRPSAAG